MTKIFEIKHPYILVLFLSPIIAELFSGSSAIYVFFNPIIFLIYLGFYGFGALIIREVVAHKQLSVASLLLFGAAFGVLEEGIIIGSWFDPNWVLGAILSKVLRVYGINVLHPFANIVYHTVISILSPILIVNSITDSKEPWLQKKSLAVILIGFIVSCLIMFFYIIPLFRSRSQFPNFGYNVSIWHYFLCFALFGAFIFLGSRKIEFNFGNKMISPLKIWLLCLIFTTSLFIIFFGFGALQFPWFLIFGLAVSLYLIYFLLALKINWENASNKHYFASAAGFISGLIPVLAASSISRPQNIVNLACLTVFVLIMILIYRKFAE